MRLRWGLVRTIRGMGLGWVGSRRWVRAGCCDRLLIGGRAPRLPPSAAAAVAARRPEGRVLTASNVEKKNDVGPRKTGRPGLGEPWKALKISRAVYFRRKAAGAL